MSKKNGLPLGEVVLFGILGALTFALKFAMAALPNIEPVTLLMMVFGAVFITPIYLVALLVQSILHIVETIRRRR